MKLAIMQPYFFPYIGYWQLINAVDKFIIYDDVTYIQRGWINRNNILISGEKKLYTMKLCKASQNQLISDVSIHDDFVKFQKMLLCSYSRAPYYGTVIEIINSVINKQNSNLASFLKESISVICSYLGVTTEIISSSALEKDNTLKGTEKIMQICKIMEATDYINAIGGTELYDKSEFKDKGINLTFLKAHFQSYTQFKNDFIPGLSIIDVMMFNDIGTIREMLEDYELT